MYRYFKKFTNELKQSGVKATLVKSYRNAGIRITRKLTLNKRSLNAWKDLKGKYEGKRAFLIGNGPSLNRTPLYLLQNEDVICFNRFTIMLERLAWKPTFYMCIDPLVADDMAAELNDMAGIAKHAFFPDIHTNGVDFRKFIKDRENILWMFPEFKGFYLNLPQVGLGGSVAYPALQVLSFLGFSEIYMIGVDMNYQIHKTVQDIQGTDVMSTKDDDPNHFDPRYFGANRKYHQPVPAIVDNIMASFIYAAEQIKTRTNIKVYNAGIGSKVECFERKNFEDIFSYSEEERYALFSQSFKHVLPAQNFEELGKIVPNIAGKAEITSGMEFFMCDVEIGISLIKDIVFDYLYFGPYKNKALFILRKKMHNA